METYGLQPLATLDADEAAVAALSDDERAELLAFAAEWDADAAAMRAAVAPIPWVVLAPIALTSIAVLVFALFIW